MEKEILTKFIEAYKLNVCLWDSTSIDYGNKQKRQAAYEELNNILKSLDSTAGVEITKKKIEMLRNSYRREKKKVEKSQKAGVSKESLHIPSLWYYPLMDSFLCKNEQSNRSGIDNIEEVDSESETSQPSTSGRSHKRKNNNDVLIQLAKNILAPKVDDEFTNFANNIASQLKRLREEQNIFAQKLISDVIFYARTESLNRYTTITNLTSNSFLPTVESPVSHYSSPTQSNTSKSFHSSPVSFLQRELIRIAPQEHSVYTLTSVTSPTAHETVHNLLPQQQQQTQYLTEDPLGEFIEDVKHEPVYDR